MKFVLKHRLRPHRMDLVDVATQKTIGATEENPEPSFEAQVCAALNILAARGTTETTIRHGIVIHSAPANDVPTPAEAAYKGIQSFYGPVDEPVEEGK